MSAHPQKAPHTPTTPSYGAILVPRPFSPFRPVTGRPFGGHLAFCSNTSHSPAKGDKSLNEIPKAWNFVKALIPHHLGEPFRDVLGKRRDKFKGAVGPEISLVTAMAHLRAVDNRTRFFDITELGQ